MLLKMKQKTLKKKGEVGNMLSLFITLGIVVIVVVLFGVLGGKMYSQTQDSIEEITNTTIRENIKTSITAAFDAQKQGVQLLPLVVLATVVGLVLFALLKSFNVVGGSRGGDVL